MKNKYFIRKLRKERIIEDFVSVLIKIQFYKETGFWIELESTIGSI